MVDALIKGSERFQRAATAVDKLHAPADGKCGECRKTWPCPTRQALDSGLYGTQQTTAQIN
jgi:hypothetical protein